MSLGKWRCPIDKVAIRFCKAVEQGGRFCEETRRKQERKMKHSAKTALAVAMSVLWLLSAMGEEVSSDVAEDAARGWINLREALGEEIAAEPESVLSYDAKDGKGKYYVVNLKGGGFVVTSGDTGLEPILAYSKDSTWNTDVARNPLMAMLNIDVAAMTAGLSSTNSANAAGTAGVRVLAAASSAQQQDGKAAKWARLRGAAGANGGARPLGASRSSLGDVRVNTLMETKWGQSGHGENQYTPRGYVCGCVATGGAQIMRYWKYPTASISAIKNYNGTIDGDASWNLNDGYQTAAGGAYTAWNDDVKTFGGTYDWNNMPGTVSSSTPAAQKKAIGKLTLDVGRSVYMDYASGGSGAHYAAFHLRLTDQFGYKNSALKISPSADEIKKGILCSLDLKSPCAVSVPGHAIVADGYGYNSGTLYVHFNFGWTGTKNAWYNPPDLSDANSAYTSINTIIYNIYPPTVCSDSGRTIVSGRLLNSSGSILPNTTVTARNRSSGATYTAKTDSKGIYALLVPAASYTISATKDNCTASTDLTVQACSSTRLAKDDGSSYYSGGTVANVHGVELTLNQLPAPTFSRANNASGTTIFDGYVNLTISSPVSGATIRYTLDGSDPTSSGTVYSSALQIASTCTVKARAFKSGYLESNVAEITFNKLSPYGDLILNGGFEQNTVTQNSGAWSYSNGDGFSCKYWTFASSAGLAAPNSTWVANHSGFGGKAAFLRTNGAGSESFVAQEFVIPNAGTYKFTFTYAARPGYVGATTRALLIRGGVTNEIASVSPTATSPSEYSGQVTLDAATMYTLRFVQTGVSGDKANIIDNVTFQMAQLPEPVFSPAAMAFTADSLDVTLSCATAGATIRYTLDGSEPTSSSPAYSTPITIAAKTTIRAKAFKQGYIASDTASATYTVAEKAAAPTSTSTAGYRRTLVDLASTVPGAVIRYTVDGSEPTADSPAYGGSIAVTDKTGATTVKARVFADGYRPSDVFSYDYYVKRFFGPTNGLNAAMHEDTPENRALYWVDEREATWEATGLWSNSVQYVDGRVRFAHEDNAFVPDSRSGGDVVTIEVAAMFASRREALSGPEEGEQTALTLDGDGSFELWTKDGWVAVAADGVVPAEGVEYAFVFKIDYLAGTFGVAVRDGGTDKPLADADGRTAFPVAGQSKTVGKISFSGDGAVSRILGSYMTIEGFRDKDRIVLKDNASAVIDAAQAEWLNALGDRRTVAGKVATVSAADFGKAFLCNLDITKDGYGATLGITAISVGDNEVSVEATLVRTNPVVDSVSGNAAPICGILRFYGASTLEAFKSPGIAPVASKTLYDDDFSESGTATAVFPKTEGAKTNVYFKAVIEKR